MGGDDKGIKVDVAGMADAIDAIEKINPETAKATVVTGVKWIKGIAGLLAACAVIIGIIFTFDSRYAHAADIDKVLENQSATLKTIQQQQKQYILFQLDYYDNRVKNLEEQQRQIDSKSKKSQADAVARQRLEQEKQDTLQKKDFTMKNLLQ